MITKAIIPVAGWGTRRLPITKVIDKSMLPIGNRPLVDYSVQELIRAGVQDIYMVVSNAETSQIKAYYSENTALTDYLTAHGKTDRLDLTRTLPDNVTIHYVEQNPAGKYGTAIPVAMAVEQYHIDEPVFVYMGDDFIWNPEGESAADSLLAAYDGHSALLGVTVTPEEMTKYAAISMENGKMTGIVEKPALGTAPSSLANVSKYIMEPDLLQHIVDYVHENDFGPEDQEYMITDPIDTFIKSGGIFRVAPTTGEYLDGGSLEGWLHANEVVCGEK